MASHLLTFNPAFMRARGGGAEPTGTEPVEVHSLNRLVLLNNPDVANVLSVRWPGFDQDAETATLLPEDDISQGTGYVPAVEMYGTADQGVAFDISSHSLSEGWIQVLPEATGRQTIDYPVVVLKGTTADLFRVITATTDISFAGTVKAQYWDGAVWQDIATLSTVLSSPADHIVDIHWKIADSGGEFTVYVNGVSEASYTGDTLRTSDTTIEEVRLGVFYDSASYPTNYGPLVIADADTRNMIWIANTPTSDGTYTEFTGGEAEVDDLIFGIGHDANQAIADASGERMTLNFPSISASYSAYAVKAVAIVFAAEAQSDPGLHLKPLVRKSSADYSPTGVFQPNSTDGPNQLGAFSMLTDPSTGSAWADQAAANSCELGLQASSTA